MTDRKTEMTGNSTDEEVVVSVEHVSKKFCRSLKRSLFYGAREIATELIGGRRENQALRLGEFWALNNVSFQLRRGAALGLVGANGAGKTTLLRIISGLIKPDTGTVRIKGHVAPLIALGAGFNPVLTGRENIYVNMSILGLSAREIDAKFQDVVDFAEIGDAINAPVQTYSSGMAARLGFSCAIHTEPDILLIDEVLAVGDIKFRVKCYRQLSRLREKGTSFVLVSHNPQSIASLCKSAIYLSKGRLIADGETDSVMNKYEEDLFLNGTEPPVGLVSLQDKPESESSGLDITYLSFKDHEGNIIESPVSGRPTYFCVGCKARMEINNVGLTFLIKEVFGETEWVLRLSTLNDNKSWNISPGEHEIQTQMPYFSLRPGLYTLKLNVSQGSDYILDAVESFKFAVKGLENMSHCLFYQPREWNLVSQQNASLR